jgi:hypothetical protein
MNLSTLCPTYDVGYGPEQWGDWAIRNVININNFDGFVIDRIEDSQSWLLGYYTRSIDPTSTNILVVDGYKNFDLAWEEGIKKLLLPKLRKLLDGKHLIGNSSGAFGDLLNGSIYESCPGNWSESIPETYEDWKEDILGINGYINISKIGFSPNFSLIETYEIDNGYFVGNPTDDPSFVPNYQRMRFGFTTALLGDGYFSYEIGTNGHGSLGIMWFDEYDNSGQISGYLGYPTSDAFIVHDYGTDGKIFRRNFNNGIVVCNPSEREAIINLEHSYKLIEGTQAPHINTGEWITSILIASKDDRILLK